MMDRQLTRSLLCAWAVAGSAALAGGQPSVPIDTVTLVGRWTQSVEEGETVVTSDPGRWDGASGPDLPALARSLFRDPRPGFGKNLAPATAYPLAVVKSVKDFTGGVLQVQFKLVAGPSDQIAGLAFGIGPAGDYVYVRYNTKDGNVAVWEFVGGKRRVLAHGKEHAQLPLGEWRTLSVQVAGRRVSGTVVGTGLSVTHELPQPVSGRIGFWTKRDATSAFKRLQVSPKP